MGQGAACTLMIKSSRGWVDQGSLKLLTHFPMSVRKPSRSRRVYSHRVYIYLRSILRHITYIRLHLTRTNIHSYMAIWSAGGILVRRSASVGVAPTKATRDIRPFFILLTDNSANCRASAKGPRWIRRGWQRWRPLW